MPGVEIVSPLTRLVTFGSGRVSTSGLEQVLLDHNGGAPCEISGYIDLSPMDGGDTMVLRLYARVKKNGAWSKYGEEVYSDAQSLPLVYITPKPETHGMRVTIQQTSGLSRTLDYEFFRKGGA